MVANPKPISIPRYAHAFLSDDLTDLSAIYEPDINICIVKRKADCGLETFVRSLLLFKNEVSFVENIQPAAFDFYRLIPHAEYLPGWYHKLLASVVWLARGFDRTEITAGASLHP